MAEPIEMPFLGLTHVGSRNHVLDGGQDLVESIRSCEDDMSVIRPFANYFAHLLRCIAP